MLNLSVYRRAVVVGFIAGLVGTFVMDLFGAGLLLVLGGPASLSFSIIGDTAAGFLSLFGIDVLGGALPGAFWHYLIGLVLGGLLGALISRVDALHMNSMKKGIGLGIVYVELMSLPMLSAAAIILQMTPAQTAQWFSISFIMHLVYGLVLGGITSYGLRTVINIHNRREGWALQVHEFEIRKGDLTNVN